MTGDNDSEVSDREARALQRHELRKLEMELEERRLADAAAQRAHEAAQRAHEAANREHEDREAERRREHEAQQAEKQREHEIKMAELARNPREISSGPSSSATAEESNTKRLHEYVRLIEGTLPTFPADSEVPIWFDSIERIFDTYAVPDNIRGQLVLPHLGQRIRYLVSRLTDEQTKDFKLLKQTVLEELRLSCGDYQRMFKNATKRFDKGWPSYVGRLKSYFTYYVDGRKVTTLDELIDLVVSDHLKSSLSDKFVRYLKLHETPEKWKTPLEIASVAQHYEEAHGKHCV